jgi:2-iminobutanoate/2-iminopropanoate deaminase
MSDRKIVSAARGPKAIGPYSQAIKANGQVFVSGQIPLDPVTQELVGSDVRTQAEQALRNVEAILSEAGAELRDVVRCVVYLTTMEHFTEMNAVYARFFPDHPPARTTVAVSGLPRNSLIEIEATALT